MDGQREQHLSGRLALDRPESSMASRSHDGESLLVTLPPEIQAIIASYLVQVRDLNHLCRTCHKLSVLVLPALYHTIELKVPLHWSRLPSLESLLASSSEGFKFTKCLKVSASAPRQCPDEEYNPFHPHRIDGPTAGDIVKTEHESRDEEHANIGNADTHEDLGSDWRFGYYDPRVSASNALNAFLRALIAKLPPQQLHTFCWDHACLIESSTLSILLKQQGASIQTLNLEGYIPYQGESNLANIANPKLTALSMTELNVKSRSVELRLMVFQSLRHLRLGVEATLAYQHAKYGSLSHDGVSIRFKCDATQRSSISDGLFERLESLSLVGVDFNDLTSGQRNPAVDLSRLSMLTLESCVGLESAFFTLVDPGKRMMRLHTLAIRQDEVSDEFVDRLKDFLLSLTPLAHLQILLENCECSVDLDEILQVHGKRLQTFVYDERTGSRNDTRRDTIPCWHNYRTLMLVSKHCPELKALGILFDWEEIVENDKKQKKIASAFSRMRQLQTLNIRTLPPMTLSCLPNDYLVEIAGTMLLDIITQDTKPEQAIPLKTLAIGAATYGNARIGGGYYTGNRVSDYLQLRIYHVNYDCRYRNPLSTSLQLIAKGTPADALGRAEYLDIFKLYWLDGVPFDREAFYKERGEWEELAE